MVWSIVLLCLFQIFSYSISTKIIDNAERKTMASDVFVAYLAGSEKSNDHGIVKAGNGWKIGNMVGMLRFDKSAWEFGKPTPFNISGHAAATLDGNAYIIGGFGTADGQQKDNTQTLKTVFVFNPNNNSYYPAADLQLGRQGSSAVAVNDKIYLTGGASEIIVTFNPHEGEDYIYYTNTTEIFDGHSWTFGPELLANRSLHVVLSSGNFIWVVGGNQNTEYLNLSSLEDGWQLGPNMTTLRKSLGAAIIGNTIYACGGNNGAHKIFASCEKLVLANDGGPMSGQQWTHMNNSLLAPRESFTMIVIGNSVYTIGGYWFDYDHNVSINALTVEEYDTFSDYWRLYYYPESGTVVPNDCYSCQATLMAVPDDVFITTVPKTTTTTTTVPKTNGSRRLFNACQMFFVSFIVLVFQLLC